MKERLRVRVITAVNRPARRGSMVSCCWLAKV